MKDRNENRPGYKKTKAGWIPEEWSCVLLSDVACVQTGLAKNKKNNYKDPISLPYLRVANVQDSFLDLRDIKEIEIERSKIDRYLLIYNDVLFTEGGDFDKLGRGTIWKEEIEQCLHQNHIFAVRCKKGRLLSTFLTSISSSQYGRRYFISSSKQSTNLASINSSQLKSFPIPLPRYQEQVKISEILNAWDTAIIQNRKLIKLKMRRKKALMQQLLMGNKRLPRFVQKKGRKAYRFFNLPEEWECPQIKEIAEERSERNKENHASTVLSCSKHKGFVESLHYFSKKVFSSDTSKYKVIRQGWFGYPSNHIEEGSIGLLSKHEMGIVSPIYTVFECSNKIVPEYLYAVFKTDVFRHIFSVSTNSPVNRRGSLRLKDFSLIRIPLPKKEEQKSIAKIAATAEAEIGKLKKKLDSLEKQKRDLMQKLLTGEVRVKA